jgi:glycosyltransferase involved in cell wall biosynthesis
MSSIASNEIDMNKRKLHAANEPSLTPSVCIVAEHASYKFGGEAILPCQYFSRLRARGIEAWLVVHARTKPELEGLFPNDRERILYVDDNWFHRLFLKGSRFLPRRIGQASFGTATHLYTQWLARKKVRSLIRGNRVNLVHQPNPVSPRLPSLMFALGVPVIIGPMNGGMEFPPAFRGSESAATRYAVFIGRRLSGLANRAIPGKMRAAALLVANERTKSALPSRVHAKVLEFPENGVDLKTWSDSLSGAPSSSFEGDKPRFVYIGRLVSWKAVDLAIDAVGRVPGACLEIIGKGPMQETWQKHVENANLSDRIIFSGWLSQDECARRLQSAVALLLPSMYESGGAVVLEAMATGTPVIATNWGGPSTYLNKNCGFLVDPTSREAMVEGFAHAMRELSQKPELARRMAANCKQRVAEEFDWERKIDCMLDIYRRALRESSGSAFADRALVDGR